MKTFVRQGVLVSEVAPSISQLPSCLLIRCRLLCYVTLRRSFLVYMQPQFLCCILIALSHTWYTCRRAVRCLVHFQKRLLVILRWPL